MKIILQILLLTIVFSSCTKYKPKNLGEKGPPSPTFDAEIVRLSDINFPNQQFSISFLLYIDYADSCNGSKMIDYAKQIRIRNAKRKPDINVIYLTDDTANCEKNLALEVNCTIEKSWNVTGYPFDDQMLRIEIYMPAYDSSKLKFHIEKEPVTFQDLNNFESGWAPDTAYTSKCINYNKFDKKGKYHSVFCFQVPMIRENPGFIFWKLFAGMYIAFFVSFVAFFINIKHVEPRFGLPVGGLFATIANKYLIESFLPLTPKLTLVDWLHDITIFAIFLIIAFSAISLKIHDMKDKSDVIASDTELSILSRSKLKIFMNWIDGINPLTFFGAYVLVNMIIVLIAICQ